MYQFTEIFGDLNASTRRRSHRWRGLGMGLLLGWAPAWALVHYTPLSAWFFPLLWILALALGYGVGFAIKK